MTFKELDREEVVKLFSPAAGGENDEWAVLPTGRNGYRQGMIRGKVRIYWDGSEGMGVHVEVPGQGCRQIEAEGIVGAWEGASGFAAGLLAQGAQVSRLDVAFDDHQGLLTPARIEAAVTEGRCVSRFRKSRPHVENELKTGQQTGGWTRYFGSAQSRVRVRMYDKAAEREEKGHQVDGDHWLRCELQLRDDRGQWALERLVTDAGTRDLAGLLRNYVDFKEAEGGDTNRSRWETCDWWAEFLGNAAKVRCTVAKVFRTLPEAAEWIQRQVAPTLSLLFEAQDYGAEFLSSLLQQGKSRLKTWQWALLNTTAAAPAAARGAYA